MSAPAPDAVLHLAALHTLAQTGFASTSRAASLTLSATLSRYLQLVATTCAERASLAGRSKVAAIDVLQGLEELGVGGVADLHDWATGLDQEVSLAGPGLAVLGEGLREGLAEEKTLVELKVVRNKRARVEDEWSPNKRMKMLEPVKGEHVSEDEDAEGDEDDEDDEDVDMDGYRQVKVEPIRHRSPDFSWLPPLPGDEAHPEIPAHVSHDDPAAAATAPAAALSIIDRYRRRIPFAQSQLCASRPFIDPPRPVPEPTLPPATSSFDSLAEAYKATLGEFTATLREVPLRQQAAELLRRQIASGEEFSPQDTLCVQIPGPRSTPIVPSQRVRLTEAYPKGDLDEAWDNEFEGAQIEGKERKKKEPPPEIVVPEPIPPRPIPLNPSRDGVLSQLVHKISSAHLPPQLRERLTSIRHPRRIQHSSTLKGDMYLPVVEGPSTVSLVKARGKQPEPGMDPGLVRPTWPMPLLGAARWSAGLPTEGVIQRVEGERMARKVGVPHGASEIASSSRPSEQAQVQAGSGASEANRQADDGSTDVAPPIQRPKFRLSLSSIPSGGGSTSPNPPAEAPSPGLTAPTASPAALSPGSNGPTGGFRFKIKSPVGDAPAQSPKSPMNGTNGTHASYNAVNGSNGLGSSSSVSPAAPGRPSLTIKFGSGSVSPGKPITPSPGEGDGANGLNGRDGRDGGVNGSRASVVST